MSESEPKGAEQTDGAAVPGAPLVALQEISKAFPGVLANDRISLEIRSGETHALLGENGAGKSTLISILSGMLSPDHGQIEIDGAPRTIDSPADALALGVGTVYQHLTLVPTLTVLENLMMGPSEQLRLPFDAAQARFDELAELLGLDISPSSLVGDLVLGQQQQVEIVKALWRDSRLLILDEPTSMLTPKGVAELGEELQRLKAEGLAIVFITHKLHEAIDLGDRVSVLRHGRKVGSIEPTELRDRTSEELTETIVGLMFGEQASHLDSSLELELEGGEPRAPERASSEVLLEISGVAADSDRAGGSLSEIDLTLHRGEVVGVAGVDGNGQKELAEVLAGQRRITAGTITFEGREIHRLAISERQQLGLRYVTDDRLGEGTVGDLDVGLNLVLKRIGQPPFWRKGRIYRDEIDATAERLVEEYDIRTPSVRSRLSTLSGGNVQKVVLARELSFDPRIVIFNKPTYGLDLRTARFVHEQIRRQSELGVASLVISTELDELIALCDRIAVMSRGRLQGIAENGPAVQERVGALMVAR
jgi:simple sugar transport system ATP-binding protein